MDTRFQRVGRMLEHQQYVTVLYRGGFLSLVFGSETSEMAPCG